MRFGRFGLETATVSLYRSSLAHVAYDPVVFANPEPLFLSRNVVDR
jgi:hypothetical protein